MMKATQSMKLEILNNEKCIYLELWSRKEERLFNYKQLINHRYRMSSAIDVDDEY